MEKETRNQMLSELESVYGEDGFVDVTDRVTCLEKGKVWSCDCGQDIGVGLNRREVVCATCNKTNIDLEWTNREAGDDKEEVQATLGQF
jgi:hypothetical protein